MNWGMLFLFPFFVAALTALVALGRSVWSFWRWQRRQAKLKRDVWGQR